MQPIFNVPMGWHTGQEPMRISLLRGEARDPIHRFLTGSSGLGYLTVDTKHLGNACPLWLKPGIHVRTRPDAADFDPSMPFLHLFRVSPFLPLGIRIGKKVLEILEEGWLIPLRNEQIVSRIGVHQRTPLLLRMDRVCAH